MSTASIPDVPRVNGTSGETGQSTHTGWSLAVRTAAFGAGAAALMGVATAFGPSAVAVAGSPVPPTPPPVCNNTTCCVEDPDPPAS